MADRNYNVDDILSEIRGKKAALQQEDADGSPPRKEAPAPALSREERQLLSRALEHDKSKGFLNFGAPQAKGAAPEPEESPPAPKAPRKESPGWGASAAQGSGPEPEEEPPVPKPPRREAPPRMQPPPAAPLEEDFSIPGANLITQPLWEDAPPRVETPDRMARAAAFITGLSDDPGLDGLDDLGVAPQPEEPKGPKGRKRPAPPPQEEAPPPKGAPKGEPKEPHKEERARPGQQLARLRTSLLVRLGVNLVTALGVLYLSLAAEYALPLPDLLTESPALFLWIGVGLVVVSGVLSGNTVGGGMIALFTLRPSSDSYIALGVFACLMQGSYFAMRPELLEVYHSNLYLPMAALLLLFNTIGKLMLRKRVEDSYHFAAGKSQKRVVGLVDNATLARHLSDGMTDEEPAVGYFGSAASLERYLDQAFSPGRPEDVSRVVAPMTAGAALVMSLVSYIFHRDVLTAACVFTAALCITAPLAGVLAANLPISLINRRLEKWGATITGYATVEDFAGLTSVILPCSDLFPTHSITLHGIKPLGAGTIDQAIVDAASVLCSCDSTLTQIFRSMVSGENLLRPAESLVYEDRMGISAWVDGRRVLVGNRELMKHYGVDLPPMEVQQKQAQGDRQVLYVANSGEAAAMFIVSYKADKQMKRALELLDSRDLSICVYSTDPNVTEERISQVYGFPLQMIRVIPAPLHPQVDRYLEPKDKVRSGIIHSGDPSSYVRAVAAVKSCDTILTVETALLLLSVVVGFALVTFFAFTRSMSALTWITIAIYQLFWTAVQVLVPALKRG